MSGPIRWLHVSDFHVGKDDWVQRRLFEKIIEHVADQKGKGFIPDVVFITGDIANAGQKSEYAEFRRGFLAPLLGALGGKDWSGTLYAIPGNHDVDRGKNPNLDRASASSPGSHFFDPTREGKAKSKFGSVCPVGRFEWRSGRAIARQTPDATQSLAPDDGSVKKCAKLPLRHTHSRPPRAARKSVPASGRTRHAYQSPPSQGG